MKPATIADKLGEVQTVLAELQEREDALKGKLIACKVKRAEGRTFRAQVLRTTVDQVDWKAIATKLYASRQMVKGNTTTIKRTQVRVTMKE